MSERRKPPVDRAVRVRGMDFTSAPGRKKPITLAEGGLSAGVLTVDSLVKLESFAAFEAALAEAGPWIAGIDFPFGQPHCVAKELGWGDDWQALARTVGAIGKQGYVDAMRPYQARRKAAGVRMRPMRRIDELAESCSPTQLDFIPVGRMFAEGAPQLLGSGVRLPAHGCGSGERIAIEAYPALVARFATQSRQAGYKNDQPRKQTPAQADARRCIVNTLATRAFAQRYGFTCGVPASLQDTLIADPTGDLLDAVLCAVQAAWAWKHRRQNWGMAPTVDPIEGWIHDPAMLEKAVRAEVCRSA